MIVLTESSDQLEPSPSSRDLAISTEAAKVAGCLIYYIPQDFSVCETAENALAHIPCQSESELPRPGYWIGYIPTFDRYQAIYRAADQKGIRLLNNPEQHRTAMKFDLSYALLGHLTPKSVVVSDVAECEGAAIELGFPVFVKGSVRSLKAYGVSFCIANEIGELRRLTAFLLGSEVRSRGRVIVRKLISLRHTRNSPDGFPLGREYRVFVHKERVFGCGYYWEGDDPLKELTTLEKKAVEELAIEAARRVRVPLMAIDVGQLEDESWIVIETGDPQFSGVGQMPLLQLWHEIKNLTLDGRGQ